MVRPSSRGRRAGLEAPQREEAASVARAVWRAPQPHPASRPARRRAGHLRARRDLDFTEMNQAAQERARRQHDPAGRDLGPRFGQDARTRSACIEKNIDNRVGADLEIGLLGQQRLHGLAVELAVGLGARAAHGRSLGKIEGAELDAGPVDGAAHDAIQRIDLAHQMALAQAADGGIARHLADRVEPVGEQQRARAGRADAAAASQPAWPPPTTITSALLRGVDFLWKGGLV